jgi:GNAT superfamily N-acetyltransferase
MAPLTDAELERRVRAGLPAELELFGSSSPTASVLRLDGVIASVSPATPDRSLFNSVYAPEPEALAARIDELERSYAEAGVRAWTVWLPAGDPTGPELLAPRGHSIDGMPRSMALELSDLVPPSRELPAGVEVRSGSLAEIGAINDAAYGLDREWGTALSGEPSIAVHWALAVEDGLPVACAGVLDVDDDACVAGVATLPDRQGRGLASILIAGLLGEAAGRGMRTGSLQASRAGAPVYERLGFRDVGNTEMWEKREGAANPMPHH